MADNYQSPNIPELPQVFKSDPHKGKKPVLPNSLSRVRIMFGVIGFLVMAVGVGMAVNLSGQQQAASSRASESSLISSPTGTPTPDSREVLVQTILSVFDQSGGASREDQNNDGR